MNIYRGLDVTEPIIKSICDILNTIPELNDANAYYKHTNYIDVNYGEKRYVELFVTSPRLGMLIFRSFEVVENGAKILFQDYLDKVIEDCVHLQNIVSQSKQLRAGFSGIKIPIKGFLVMNSARQHDFNSDIYVVSLPDIKFEIEKLLGATSNIFSGDYNELIAIIEGSKILQKHKRRIDSGKGLLAQEIERNIALFGNEQRDFIYAYPISGFQILRGLAGSGKTVLLSRKAAELHKNNPDTTIIYTFYTKSLYQTVRNYIQKFYACLSPDKSEPNWEKLKIMHAWGGSSTTGVYYDICKHSNSEFLSFSQALQKDYTQKPFDVACKNLLSQVNEKTITPICDYLLIDEGQDFPISFIKMCVQFTKKERVIWAYDDLQTIFQENNPSAQAREVGVNISDSKNLKICYRNPNQILICAHALGFGLYGEIIQTFESKTDWENLGYKVIGEFAPENKVKLTRPEENVRHVWSTQPDISEIIDCQVFDSTESEISSLIKNIQHDINTGLSPEDILIICINDHNAKSTASEIEYRLSQKEIRANNLQADVLNMYDFTSPNEITISTVHKAKGNEAFQVYIVGIEAILSNESNKLQMIKSRNMLYTAMTRSKGCLMLSGVGAKAEKLKTELEEAKKNYPDIEFIYPKQEELRLIKNNIKIAQAPDELLSSVKNLRNILGKDAFEQLIANLQNEG